MIYLKKLNEIDKIIESCSVVSKVLKHLKKHTKQGMTTKTLNVLAEELIREENALPGFKNFNNYPYAICASINDIAIQGLPCDRQLKTGDVLKIDVGVLKDGFYGDAAFTMGIGDIDIDDEVLINTTKQALYSSILVAQAGNTINSISHEIQKTVENKKLTVIKQYGGHGIGRRLHEEPFIKNFTTKINRGPLLKEGMIICIEPLVTKGTDTLIRTDNGWSMRTKDGANTAHFEHTVLITGKSAEILTKN